MAPGTFVPVGAPTTIDSSSASSINKIPGTLILHLALVVAMSSVWPMAERIMNIGRGSGTSTDKVTALHPATMEDATGAASASSVAPNAVGVAEVADVREVIHTA